MKALRTLTLMAALGVAASSMVGCTSAQKGAAGGGVLGGLAGMAIGNNTGASPSMGAAIGASTGVAVGGLAGDAYDQVTQKDIERELENLRAELAAKESELAQLRGRSLSPEQEAELAAAKARLAELEGQLANAVADAEKNGQRADTELANRAELQQALARLQNEANDLRDRIAALDSENGTLRDDLARLRDEVARMKDELLGKNKTIQDLENQLNGTQDSLRGKDEELEGLRGELEGMHVKLDETSRGITLTVLDSLLYKPGKADLSDSGKRLVADVSKIVRERFPNRELLVEGHTDNQPIRKSGWKSNWELGAARSLALVHELANTGISPSNLSAASFGEFRPTSTNATADGRKSNRRAVIVILPEKVERKQLASN